MKTCFQRFVRDTSGVTAIEYALIGIIVAIAVVFGATTIGATLNSTLQSIVPTLAGGAGDGG